jgi:hypothetical protein
MLRRGRAPLVRTRPTFIAGLARNADSATLPAFGPGGDATQMGLASRSASRKVSDLRRSFFLPFRKAPTE